MEQYINKSALVAEIEKRIKKYATINVGGSKELDALYGAKCKALMEILSFLDTIEVKEVEQGKKELIDKACEWLLNNVGYYSTNALGAEYMCEDFRKAMEDE